MKVVITGGAGFIGSRLARTLLARGELAGRSGRSESIDEVVIFDQAPPESLPSDPRLRIVTGNFTDKASLLKALEGKPDTVIHLASVVSGGAEADLQLGMSVNLDGTRQLLDLLADPANPARLLFSSSLAVYGGGTEEVTDGTTPWPKSSYGVQKLCCELLIGDYHRRGLIDGRSMRFPTIAIRPGKANLANSSFISSIVREPVAGRKTACPVPPETEISLMSPGRLVDAIIRVHDLDSDALGWPRSLLLPAVKVTVAEMLDALATEAGEEMRELVSFEPEPGIIAMVKSWPVNIAAARAEALGIRTDPDALAIVQDFLAENRA
jgi:nucleoside-diphosphate-sugar epimerase